MRSKGRHLCIKYSRNEYYLHNILYSNFQDLQIVSLRLQTVNNAGEPGEMGRLCPNIVELDLSKNLFNNWTLIFEICDQLENLIWLNVR